MKVSNVKIFDGAVCNYARGSPYIRDGISVPVRYGDDRRGAEAIILQATRRHAHDASINGDAVARNPEWRFELRRLDFRPRVCISVDKQLVRDDDALRFSRSRHARGEGSGRP